MITLLAVVLLCVLYGIASILYSQKDKVYSVMAGHISKSSDTEIVTNERTPKIVSLNNGKLINTHDYIRITIKGDCMTKKNVFKGEEWLVEPVKLSNLEKKVRSGDILLIFYEDKSINVRTLKIRELKGFMENGLLDTQYYDGEEPQKSTNPHTPESVRGILRYCISPIGDDVSVEQ
jgi:hypothetical protein